MSLYQFRNILVNKFFNKINKNTYWLIAYFVATSLSQLFLYSFINYRIGKIYLGLWALVVAATSIGQISGFGFSNGLVRYLPDLLIKKEYNKIQKIFGTVNFSNFFLSLPFLIILYFPIKAYASNLLNQDLFQTFNKLIAWYLPAIFLNNIFSTYSCLFDGFQKFYLRCIIQISGWLIFTILLIVFFPHWGLESAGMASFFQSIWQCTLAFFITSKYKLIKNGFHLCFDKESFKLVSNFGSKSFLISILVVIFDPIIKFFLTQKVGLSGVANYELVSKITIQARNLLSSINLPIIPKIVEARSVGGVNDYFLKVSYRNLYISIGISILMFIFSPLVLQIILHEFDPRLMVLLSIVNIGYVCSTITTVHYYSCMGLDKMSNLVIVHFLYASIACMLFLFLNYFNVNQIVYFIIPSICIFIGSFYNSFVLKKINGAFNWLFSGVFLFFLFESGVLIFYPLTSMIQTLTITLCFLFLFIFIFFNRIKSLIFNRL
jgi:O-antigen/teichoic acid export membrane protein